MRQKPVPMASPAGVGLDSSAVRARMVQKLAEQGVTDAWVLEAMGRTERHRFVDSALVNQAYEDTSLPIGLGQTISKPNVVARMMELLRQAPGLQVDGLMGRVLEIGTGCGYQAAVLSHLAREVYSMERLRGLHDKARENLRPLRLPNVHVIFGDGMLGYPQGRPTAQSLLPQEEKTFLKPGSTNWLSADALWRRCKPVLDNKPLSSSTKQLMGFSRPCSKQCISCL
jgi:protein-L-isoaspartate(D-aspartate) O-methyltransferase